MAIWYILWPFSVVCANLVYFSRFGLFEPIQNRQPYTPAGFNLTTQSFTGRDSTTIPRRNARAKLHINSFLYCALERCEFVNQKKS
jgi:hypothetical protein